MMETAQRMNDEQILYDKMKTLIAIGAATAANCIPCFENLYEKAIGSGISSAEIKWAAEIAGQVKKGANIALENYVDEFIGIDKTRNLACGGTEKTSCCC